MNAQTISIIEQSTKGSMDRTMSFPEVVRSLMEVGVSHYHLDFLRNEKTSYLRDGQSHVSKLDLSPSAISQQFSATEMAAAVKSSQTEGQTFPVFANRARQAGCTGYFANLDGRKVGYTGWGGEEHVEHFLS